MNDWFYMHFETMPKTTAQQKGVYVRNGKPYFYTKDKVESARREFLRELKPHRPKAPADYPVKLFVIFYFDVKNKSLWGKPKTTKPDLDNYLKLLKDCMTEAGYWVDDALVVDERTKKYYADKPVIAVWWDKAEEGGEHE